MQITVDISDTIGPRLNAFRKVNTRDLLSDVEKYFNNMIEQSFRGMYSPYGNAWAPVKPETLQQRKVRTDGILVDTGDLRRSSAALVTTFGSIDFVQDDVKSVHNWGNDANNVPARPSLPIDGLTAEMERDIQRLLLSDLRKKYPWL